jgi:inositol transport system ATP-binding protein
LILRARNVSKSYSGVRVLDGVTLDIERGRVHALMGENGAGKSTLLKILAGLLPADSGGIEFAGPGAIAMIHQELMAFRDLTVAENLWMGREPVRRFAGWIDRGAMRSGARRVLDRLGSKLDPDRKMRGLSVADMQMVEIAKALAREAEVVLMDEPTSALAHHESEALFGVIRELTACGVAVVYTSHKMDEIFRIAETISVLRDGRHIATEQVSALDERRLIALMVGRELESAPAGSGSVAGEVALEVRALSKAGRFEEVSFEARHGEVVAIAGLMGAGRTELVSAVYGLDPADSGEIRVNGNPVRITEPAEAIRHGIALVTEDRKESGIIPHMGVAQNLTLASLRRVCRGPWIDRARERETADRQMRAFAIKARGRDQEIETLSGGNQQKAMLAKALLTEPGILILDEPTRGIDIAAKAEVHAMIRQLARAGKAIVMISSEMPEILALSDRILVMRGGRISAELNPRGTTQDEILKFAMPD